MDKEEKFYFDAAIDFLKNLFGIEKPTNKHIEEMQSLLFHTWLKRKVNVDRRLTKRERFCLLLSSQGKTYLEIAEVMGISPDTVKTYEKAILQKLKCKNMKQAITIGLRYGEIEKV